MNKLCFHVTTEQIGLRTDVFLAKVSGRSRSSVAKLIEHHHVTVNGNQTLPKCLTKENDEFIMRIPAPVSVSLAAQDIPIDIVYQDDDIAVINKQRGLSVHPGAGQADGTLVNALLAHLDHLSGINGEIRPGIVHRLDKNTTGLMIVAKNDRAHQILSEAIANRHVKREYVALVHGNVLEDSGTIEAPIGRHPKDRKKMAIVQNGRFARTHYSVLTRYGKCTLVQCTLDTGRTHQIRVHMASIQHPVFRDPVYGIKSERNNNSGQFLHAFRISFHHPITDAYMCYSAPLPVDFHEALKKLGQLPPELDT